MSLLVWPPGVGKTSRLGSRDSVASGSSVDRMVARTADEVVYGFLVEPQNQGRAGTTWEPIHEW
jgi:hypothetical protein